MLRPGDYGQGMRYPRASPAQEPDWGRQPPTGLATPTTRSTPSTPRCTSGTSSGRAAQVRPRSTS